MLTKRIIPCLDVKDGRVVKGVQFEDLIDLDDPIRLGSYYAQMGADELVFYDIAASSENRGITAELVEQIAANLSIPFTVGGGIASLDDFYRVLGAGADKVSINSAAVRNPTLIYEGAKRFGSQCVVVSMDIKREIDGRYQIYVQGGRTPTGLDALEWAKGAEFLGAGELVLNAIHADGMKNGFDLELTRLISENVSIPVVASGGAGSSEDFYHVLVQGKADAALAASVFHTQKILIPNLKQSLHERNLPIRL